MSSKKKNIYIFVGKVILVTLLIVLFIRCFFIELFSVYSPQMESALSENDKVLIDKTAYGIRLPVTLLSIPFTFDNIFGFKSYSSALQLPYKRIFESRTDRNDVVLFNNPLETDKPLDKGSLILSRIVGLPGDSVEMGGQGININEQYYTNSPSTISKYRVKLPEGYNINDIVKEHDIILYGQKVEQDTLFLSLNAYDAFILDDLLPDTVHLVVSIADTVQTYKFRIPSRDEAVTITKDNFIYYKQIISWEQKTQDVFFAEDMLIINGVKYREAYTFGDDYYWVLSDNADNALDSRHLGFIPFRNIIGKVSLVWYSGKKDRSFSRIE